MGLKCTACPISHLIQALRWETHMYVEQLFNQHSQPGAHLPTIFWDLGIEVNGNRKRLKRGVRRKRAEL